MAQHEIRLKLPAQQIVNSDAQFDVYADKEKLGTLTVSRGGIGWFPFNARNERHCTWREFARWMEKQE